MGFKLINENITIVGGGNIGTQFTVHFKEYGYPVILYTSHPENFNKKLSIINEKNEIVHTCENYVVTNDKNIAFKNASIIFITVPAFAMKQIANEIEPYINKNIKIVIVPGTGGAEWAFLNCIKKGAEVFGLQRVPSVARIEKTGSIVKASGYRKMLFLGGISNNLSLLEISNLLSNVFKIKCVELPNYLSVTLTPSNPILHTSRLYNIFKDFDFSKSYEHIPLFYEEWDVDSSKTLLDMDNEVQNICESLSDFDLHNVLSLRKHYESNDAIELTAKIKSIASFKGLGTPCIKTENGYIPDFNSRYFIADFPFGLNVLIQIADLLKVNCPKMKKVYMWYKTKQPSVQEFSFKEYGITRQEQFIGFYKDFGFGINKK